MVSDALVGLAAGLAAGVVMTRGGLCFNRAVRQAALEHKPRLLRAFGLAVALQLLLLPVLVAIGVDPLERSAETGGLPLLPVAQVVGGLTFGVGMALAGGCITGMLWKAGGGAVALGIAIAGFAAGELLIRGPGDSLIADLDDASRPGERALTGLLGVDYEPLALAVGVAALVLLLRRRRDGLIPGVALGLVAAAAWIAADAAGYGYGLGFVGAAEGTRRALDTGGQLPFQLWLALGVVAGGRGRRPPAAADARRRQSGTRGRGRRADGRRREPRPRLQHRPRPDRPAAALLRLPARRDVHGARRDRCRARLPFPAWTISPSPSLTRSARAASTRPTSASARARRGATPAEC